MRTAPIALLCVVLVSACSAPTPAPEVNRTAETPIAVSAKDPCMDPACAAPDAATQGEALRSRGRLGRSLVRAVSLF